MRHLHSRELKDWLEDVCIDIADWCAVRKNPVDDSPAPYLLSREEVGKE